MLRIIFYILPFMTCLFWFVTFALRSRSNDSAKRVLTVFLGTCTVLYLCHAFFFLTEELPVWADSIWGLCSLSVYPLYFIYITHLTCRPLAKGQTAMCLLPGLLVALAMLICPGEEVGTVRKLVNAVQIICVIYFGYRRLHAFDKEVANIYADTEGRDTSAVKILLIAFTAISILSVVVNMAGRQYFASSEWLLMMLSLLFASLLYSLSYIGFIRDFSCEQFLKDTDGEDEGQISAGEINYTDLRRKIDELMDSHYYLNPNIKINDLVNMTGYCRTYVSTYINRTYNCSFSDYVNQLRVRHAQNLLKGDPEMKVAAIVEMVGFANENSFYRNFRKFAGMTPSDWADAVRKGKVPEES